MTSPVRKQSRNGALRHLVLPPNQHLGAKIKARSKALWPVLWRRRLRRPAKTSVKRFQLFPPASKAHKAPLAAAGVKHGRIPALYFSSIRRERLERFPERSREGRFAR